MSNKKGEPQQAIINEKFGSFNKAKTIKNKWKNTVYELTY
jgi:hypothetical protein